MKQTKHLLATIVMLLCGLTASAHDFEVDGIYYEITSSTEKTVAVTYKGDSWSSYSKEYTGAVIIPETVTYNSKTYRVTSIGQNTFIYCSSLTSITIPKSVTEIGDGAFSFCSSLTSIAVAEGNTIYDSRYNCNAIIETRTNQLVVGCNTTIIPEDVTSIGEYAFRGCSSLTAITIPEGVTSIGDCAFQYCSSLTAINIPEGVTRIGSDAFYDCSSLISIVVAEGNTVYDSRDNCNAIIETRTNQLVVGCNTTIIPEDVTSIGEYAFYYCERLTSITIPESVTSIGDYAFYKCSSLTSINIPENSQLTAIGNSAFSYCSSLTAITISEGVTEIGSSAFSFCSSLTSITIPEGVTSIGSSAFYYCSSLTSITIPEGVTSIGDNTFERCNNLTSITIPEGVTSIGNWAFSYCGSLTSITIPESVTSIGNWAFSHCSSLTSIFVAEGNTIYDSRNNCNAIIETRINQLVEGCNTTIIPEDVTSIRKYAFSGRSSLTSITIPESVTSIGEFAFYYCAELTDVYCHAENVPSTSTDAFNSSYPEYATLHVPASAIKRYKITAPWSRFGTIEELILAEVAITINQYGSGTYCSKYALDFSNVEGLKAYAATGYNSGTGVVTLVRVMTAKAGEGLFIKGEPGKYMVPIMESTLDNTLNMLVGTLAKTEVNSTSDDGLYANYKYTIKADEATPKFYQFEDGSNLSAGKAYLQIPMAWLPATDEAKSISLRFEEGEGTTDMENSQFTIDNSQLTYDLYGRRVDNPVKGGIYIVGGRKVVVK